MFRFVGRFIPRKERLLLMGDKLRKFNNVYIKNFDEDLDDDKLLKLFEPYGKIISAKVNYFGFLWGLYFQYNKLNNVQHLI